MAARRYPSYRVYRDKRGEYRWSYEAANGKTIGISSEGYVKKADCLRSVEILKTSAGSDVWEEEATTAVA